MWHADGSMARNKVQSDSWEKSKNLGENLSSIDMISPQCGRRYEASGMEASKTMAEVAAES